MVSNAQKQFQQPVAITAKRQNLHCSLEAPGSGLGTAFHSYKILLFWLYGNGTKFCYSCCMEMMTRLRTRRTKSR